MSLTHINCNIFRGSAATTDTSSYVALNPRGCPGSLVLSVSTAAKDSISSQVACKLGLEHFVDGVLDYYENNFPEQDKQSVENTRSISLEVLETAFKKANTSVYQFAHKLAAGGRMASTLMGVVLEDKIIAAGKVGPGNVFLFRKGELFPFFENNQSPRGDIAHETLIGAHSFVSVELASVPAEEGDRIIVFPFTVKDDEKAELKKLLTSSDSLPEDISAYICKHIFPDVYKIPFGACAEIGPDTIYLARAV